MTRLARQQIIRAEKFSALKQGKRVIPGRKNPKVTRLRESDPLRAIIGHMGFVRYPFPLPMNRSALNWERGSLGCTDRRRICLAW